MELSSDLVSQFVKVTKDEVEIKHETTVYGTIVVSDDRTFVQLDGSELLTPVSTTTGTRDGDRVTVMIKDHSATVTGNLTDPSAGTEKVGEIDGKVGELSGQISEFEIVLADKVSTEELEATYAKIEDLDATYAKIEDLDATYAKIEDLDATNATIENLDATYAKIEDLEATNATIKNLDAAYATIDLANVNNAWIENGVIKDAAIADAQIVGVSANKLTAGTIDASNITVTNLNADNLTVGTINGKLIGDESVTLDKLAEEVPTKEYLDRVEKELQGQIDGTIETWISDTVPTLNNYPAINWKVSYTSVETTYSYGYLKSTGVATSGTSSNYFRTTDFIAVEEGQVYRYTGLTQRTSTTTAPTSVCGYDSEQNFVEVILSNGTYTDGELFTIASGIAYIRCCFSRYDADLNDIEYNIELGTTLDAVEKAKAYKAHVGDVLYVKNAASTAKGYCYTFIEEKYNTYAWALIENEDILNALQELIDANGDVSGVEQFSQTSSFWLTNTGAELSSLKISTTEITTELGEKVSTTTFNELKQTVETNSSTITQFITDGESEDNLVNRVSSIEQTATSLTTQISELTDDEKEGSLAYKISTVEQTADGLTTTVSDLENGLISKINQSAEGVTIDAEKVDVDGVVTFINSDENTTTIDGGKINAKTLNVDDIFARDVTATGNIDFDNDLYALKADDSGDMLLESYNNMTIHGELAIKIMNDVGYIYMDTPGYIQMSPLNEDGVTYYDGTDDYAYLNTKNLTNYITDYVVAQGTSGIWTYRKWNSGLAECFGRKSFSDVACTNTFGSSWYRTSGLAPDNYPFTFIESPHVYYEYGPGSDGTGALLWVFTIGGTTAPSTVQACRPVSTSSLSGYIYYHAIGWWK